MNEEGAERGRRGHSLVRAIANSGRGLVIFGIGVFFLVSPMLGVTFNLGNGFRYFFSGMCLFYGGWRVYRGYRNN
jgi:hypothetical protein